MGAYSNNPKEKRRPRKDVTRRQFAETIEDLEDEYIRLGYLMTHTMGTKLEGAMKVKKITVRRRRLEADYLAVVNAVVHDMAVVAFASATKPPEAIRLALEKVYNNPETVKEDKWNEVDEHGDIVRRKKA